MYQLSSVIDAKAILEEEQKCFYLTHSWGDMDAHYLSLKVNLIGRLEFELGYFEVTVKDFSNYVIPINLY